MKRRSDAPLTILIIGIAAVVLLGLGVIRYTGQTPVLQLPPAIKQRFGHDGVVARFKRGTPPWVEVELPADAGVDRLRLAEIGAFALTKYREVAPTTRTEWIVVRVKDRPPEAALTVTQVLASYLEQAQGSLEAVRLAAAKGTTRRPNGNAEEVAVQLLGLSATGVDVRVTGKAVPSSRDAADGAVAAVSSLLFVGRVEVELQGPRGALSSVGGRDAPRRPRR